MSSFEHHSANAVQSREPQGIEIVTEGIITGGPLVERMVIKDSPSLDLVGLRAEYEACGGRIYIQRAGGILDHNSIAFADWLAVKGVKVLANSTAWGPDNFQSFQVLSEG